MPEVAEGAKFQTAAAGLCRYNAGDFQEDADAFSLSSWLATVPPRITAQVGPLNAIELAMFGSMCDYNCSRSESTAHMVTPHQVPVHPPAT